MLSSLWNLGAFIVALSVLVAVHEFGHFWVARICGVKVERFSIGFGKVLFKWFDKKGTEFAVAAIPLGGYVKMLDGRIDKLSAEDEAFAFDKKTVWQRIAIVSAGPVANFILAVIAFFFMYMIGVNSAKPIVETTEFNSPMSVLQDEKLFQVVAINSQPVEDWDSLNLALVNQIGENQFNITIQPLKGSNTKLSSEPTKSFTVSLQDWQFDPKAESIISSLGFVPYTPAIYLEVGQLTKSGAADNAGLRIGDKLLSIDGEKLNNWQQFVELIQKNAEQTLQLEIERGTITQIVKLTPAARRLESEFIQGHIGVSPVIETYPEEYRIKLQFGPLAALDRAIGQTGLLTKLTFNTIVKLVSGDISVKNLSGPVAIAKGAGMSANYGIEYFLGFLALISINLGLMNLIPLPVLDGGHLLYYFFEVVTGKAVSERVQQIGFKIGGAILITLMMIAILNDFDLL